MGAVGQLHPPIQLTPSLSRLYKEPLIEHVLGWPAEQVERGCNRISEEAHQISSHGITKVKLFCRLLLYLDLNLSDQMASRVYEV